MTPKQRASQELFGDIHFQPAWPDEPMFALPRTQEIVSYNALVERYRTPKGQTRKGDWMQTSSGRQFWPLDPRAEEIHIEDIAHALGMLCRYGGQCLRFYSVAEHCVLMARAAPPEHKLAALLHDASEAYLCDVIRPIKSHLTNYLEIEAGLERVIAQRFGLAWPMPAEVKRMDTAILSDERDQAMAPPPVPWPQTTEPPLGVRLEFWTPEMARIEFRAAFAEYSAEPCNCCGGTRRLVVFGRAGEDHECPMCEATL